MINDQQIAEYNNAKKILKDAPLRYPEMNRDQLEASVIDLKFHIACRKEDREEFGLEKSRLALVRKLLKAAA